MAYIQSIFHRWCWPHHSFEKLTKEKVKLLCLFYTESKRKDEDEDVEEN